MVHLNNRTTNKVTRLPNNTSTDALLDALVKLDALIHNTPTANAASLDTSTDMFSGASRNNTPTTNAASLDDSIDMFSGASRNNTPTTNAASLDTTNAASLDDSIDMFSGASRNNTPTTNAASLDTTNADAFLDALGELDTLIHNTNAASLDTTTNAASLDDSIDMFSGASRDNTPTTNAASLKEYDKIKQAASSTQHIPHALKWTTLALLSITILLTATIGILTSFKIHPFSFKLLIYSMHLRNPITILSILTIVATSGLLIAVSMIIDISCRVRFSRQ